MVKRSRFRKYFGLIREDLAAIYSRDLHKWLLVAPIIGLLTGLVTTGITVIILNCIWPLLLGYFLRHHLAIIPGLLAGFVLTGNIMQQQSQRSDSEAVLRSKGPVFTAAEPSVHGSGIGPSGFALVRATGASC